MRKTLQFIVSSPLTAFSSMVSAPYLLASWAFSRKLAMIDPAARRQSAYLTMVVMTAIGVAAVTNLVSATLGGVLPKGGASFAAIYSLAVFYGLFAAAREKLGFLDRCWNGAAKAHV